MEKNLPLNQSIENEPDFHSPDWLLQYLVDLANQDFASLPLPLTLVTHGYLICGYLASGNEYFEGVTEEIRQFFEEPESKNAYELKNHLIELGRSTYDNPETKNHPPTFIHLKKARYNQVSGFGIPSNSSVWWRGRISEISGFSIGVFETSYNDDK